MFTKKFHRFYIMQSLFMKFMPLEVLADMISYGNMSFDDEAVSPVD